jgi:hypothetical protein
MPKIRSNLNRYLNLITIQVNSIGKEVQIDNSFTVVIAIDRDKLRLNIKYNAYNHFKVQKIDMIVRVRTEIGTWKLVNKNRFAKLDFCSDHIANAIKRALMTVVWINPFQNEVRRLIWIRKDFLPPNAFLVRRQLFESAVDRLKVNQTDRVICRRANFEVICIGFKIFVCINISFELFSESLNQQLQQYLISLKCNYFVFSIMLY